MSRSSKCKYQLAVVQLVKFVAFIKLILSSQIYTVRAKSIRTRKFLIKKVLFVENKH